MAADGINKLQIQLIHGTQRHDVTLELPPEENGEVLSVGHLMRKAAQLTGIPDKNQRLISKGRSLTKPETSLKSYGLKDGCKIMLIGKKHSEEDEDTIKQLSSREKQVNKTQDKLSEVIHEADGIHRGFLSSDLMDEALKKLGKRLAVCVEEFTRHLEALDKLSLGDTTQEARSHRKRLVTKIQDALVQCDSIATGIEDIIKQMKISAR